MILKVSGIFILAFIVGYAAGGIAVKIRAASKKKKEANNPPPLEKSRAEKLN